VITSSGTPQVMLDRLTVGEARDVGQLDRVWGSKSRPPKLSRSFTPVGARYSATPLTWGDACPFGLA
jgi:hypothetical protein